MGKICGIYKITSPSKKIYIGQSIDCNGRKYRYKSLDCKNQYKIYHSIKKHGWGKHNFEIIHECLPKELNELEKYYVDLYQTFNSEYGLNCRSGGNSLYKLPLETRLKMSKSRMGGKRTKEQKLRMKSAQQRRNLTSIRVAQ